MRAVTSQLSVFAALVVLFAASSGTPVKSGELETYFGGAQFTSNMTTFRERRFTNVIKQQYDFSCGSAAIASLLTYHYDRPTTEAEVFEAMYEAGDQKTIRTKGFSLLDMKVYLEANGYQADGFRVGLDQIQESKIPAIVVIRTRGYQHFVLIKGVSDEEVVVGDPALGTKVYTREKFEEVRDGDIVFVIRSDRDVAEQHFNQEEDWSVRPDAPFGSALTTDGLSDFLVNLPTTGQFY